MIRGLAFGIWGEVSMTGICLRSRVSILMCLLIGVGAGAFSSSAKAALWPLQTTPNGTGAEHSALYDMACEPQSTSVCTAVGQQTISGVSSPYAQYWNGSTWVNQSAEAPVGATGGELQADHCLSKTSCISAGSYTTKSGTFSLIESWDGSKWAIQSTPNPEGATETKLKGVSCKEITACIAVGYSNAGGKWATVIRGNSGTWSLQTMPKPAESISSELTGVECTSSTSCVAVGAYNTSASTYWAMAATWNGTEWLLKTVPKPTGSKKSILLDVSCSDASNCTAVGAYTNSENVQVTFVARWNGTSWTQQESPNPAEATNSVLQNIACPDRYSCVAVGDSLNSGMWRPMAQYWNGTSWSLDATSHPTGATFALFEGVACRIRCMAVGWYTDSGGSNKTLGAIRDLTNWSQRPLPAPTSTNDTLSGVACYATNSCFAVGTGASIARVYAGGGSGEWTANATPQFGTSIYSQLREISCRTVGTSTTCIAVGVYKEKAGIEKSYAAEWWSGTGKWVVYTVVLPAGSESTRLNDVSCPPGTNTCYAVGDYTIGGVRKTYAASYNGGTWTLQSTPNSGSTSNVLNGVSCTSASACTAVGYIESTEFLKPSQPLVMRWNGTSWTIQSISLPAGSGGVLYGVSCTSATDCLAVGSYAEGFTLGGTYATKWNGSGWTTVASPRLAFTSSHFEDVACTATNACVAVGSYGPSTGSFAAEWDGTGWMLQNAASPGTSGNILASVACPATATCRAAGSETGGGATHNLVETYP